jgi:lipopolysaccharide/colanic/teichoic acid biosynthesis glycosyltransferase
MSPYLDRAQNALAPHRKLAKQVAPLLGRTLDLSLALIALIVFGPLMLMLTLVVAAERKGPVLFRHTRIGRNGKSFRVLKFRSMHVNGDAILAAHLIANPAAAEEWALDHKLRDDPRVTRLGRFLRKSSLDELPQLFNVLVGDMSIVGPRPIVQSEVARYGRFFKAYCSVRPGITGIWQVSGRNNVSYKRRVLMDAVYARRKCVALDIKLILATIPAVLARKGSY